MEHNRLILISCATLSLMWCTAVQAQPLKDGSVRVVYSMNQNWEYLEDDIGSYDRLAGSRQQWKEVQLPHTWNKWDVMDMAPGYRRAAGWYRRELPSLTRAREEHFLLCFEGVNMKCEVFVNGKQAGGHVGGYIGFNVDITPYVNPSGKNIVHVKADNSYDPNLIPSQKSDFFLYGGITRNVWLRIVPAAYVERVRIRTPRVSKTAAETTLDIAVVSSVNNRAVVEAMIRDPQGREVARKKLEVSLLKKNQTVTVQLPVVANPALWSPSTPSLYTAVVALISGEQVIDSTSERFGYRWFEFKEHGPFHLNGERLLLRGTHRHEEWAGYGNALPDTLHRREMKMIKEMGANFVRLAHYPQAPEVYRACDELGLLVWDELPWCRGGMGGDAWKQNTRRMLNEMIAQNYNHPSIIIWSLGNELDWVPDFPGGDNVDSLRAFLSELNSTAHSLDPYRVTATRRFDEGADLVDVHSSSLWLGWYSSTGGYRNYENAIRSAAKKFKRFFHAEYGGDSHVGRHTENPVDGNGMLVGPIGEQNMLPVATHGDWGESYIVDLFDWCLHVSEQQDWFTGNAQWIFKDFGTPLRPENPIPYVNQKGLVDLGGTPKDAYYVFKSYWTERPKFCYVESHTWTHRSGPVGVKREVNVFSNCSEVELFKNGVSQGKRTRDIKQFPASGLRWQLEFDEGNNVLLALGFEGAARVTQDSIIIRYTHVANQQPDRIELSSEQLPNGNILVTALAVDKNGQRCLDYNKRVYFTLDGAGQLLASYGTPTRSPVIEMTNGKAAIECKIEPSGKAVIDARNQDFKGTFLVLGR